MFNSFIFCSLDLIYFISYARSVTTARDEPSFWYFPLNFSCLTWSLRVPWNCGLYNWRCLYMLLSLLFIFLSSNSLCSPLCTSLFQICVQFPFLSTGPRTISFKDIIEWGLKSRAISGQHLSWSPIVINHVE